MPTAARYRRRQIGVGTNLGLAAVLLVVLFVAATTGVLWITVPLLLLFAALLAIFWSLTVEVTTDRVSCWYGSGWPRRDFAAREIRSAETVRNRWYYGFGVRLTPHGWMFNLSGLDAVELELASGDRFRIGTPEPERLVLAIREVVARRPAAESGS